MADKQEKDFPGILVKRGKIWHYQLYVPEKRGIWKRSTGQSNYRLALAEARKLHAQAALLTESRGESPKLSRAIVKETERIAEQTSERQAERVGIQLANFLAWHGDGPLEKITTKVLEEYQRYRSKSPRRVWRNDKWTPAKNGALVTTNTINKEVQSIVRLLKENGFNVQRPQAIKGKGRPGRPFTKEELKAFFEACARYPAEEPGRFTPLFLLLLATGARPAEIIPSPKSSHIALLKREIDFDAGTITIRSAKVHRGSRGKVTKLSLSPAILEILQKISTKVPGPHLFPEYHIGPVFDRILKAAAIEKIDELGEKLTAHSFRHTFGTMLAEQGANAFVIQNVLRHSDPKMTARYVERATTAAVIDISEFLIEPRNATG